jgi:hypothetical protein
MEAESEVMEAKANNKKNKHVIKETKGDHRARE